MYRAYAQSMGPTAASPELFAEALFTDASSWTVIDRGPFEALVPITEVLDNMLSYFDEDSPGKAKLEVSRGEKWRRPVFSSSRWVLEVAATVCQCCFSHWLPETPRVRSRVQHRRQFHRHSVLLHMISQDPVRR